MAEKKSVAYRRGVVVLVGLAVLTLIEYFVALVPGNMTVWLFIIGLFKAGLIMHFFMHMAHLWSEEGDH